jgi:PII-like signaling protein
MKDVTTAKLLRIHIGELDRARHKPLFEILVTEARVAGLSGATVLRGIESFGASSVVHRSRLLELSEDLPIVVEIVDTEEKIRAFLERIEPILDEAGCGVLMTMEKVEILRWAPKKKS